MSQTASRDIQTKADIHTIVESFYTRLLKDPAIGFFFTDIANIDLAEHLPKVTDFWAFQVLGHIGYSGNIYGVHQHIHKHSGLRKEHFDWWLVLFEQSIKQHFIGNNADKMKRRATLIAKGMSEALEQKEAKLAIPGVHLYTPA